MEKSCMRLSVMLAMNACQSVQNVYSNLTVVLTL